MRIVEVKINKEIRDYTEKVYFGLSLRQFIFSLLACVVAVVVYFLLKPYFGIETLSWICILCAFPFAALGFIKYNKIIKSKILTPKHLTFKSKNLYYEIMKEGDGRKNVKSKKNTKKG